jgi:cytochrome c oxidase subunit 2
VNFGVPFFPQEASSEAGHVDALFYTLLVFSAVLGLTLTGLVVGYAVKYRVGSKADRTGQRSRTMWLEMSWTVASLIIAFIFFGWGAVLFAGGRAGDHGAGQTVDVGVQATRRPA